MLASYGSSGEIQSTTRRGAGCADHPNSSRTFCMRGGGRPHRQDPVRLDPMRTYATADGTSPGRRVTGGGSTPSATSTTDPTKGRPWRGLEGKASRVQEFWDLRDICIHYMICKNKDK